MKFTLKIIFIFLLFLCYSCRYDKGQPEVICYPPDTTSFKNDIMPVFNNHCNTSGCHSAADNAGGLMLDSADAYSQLMASGTGYIDTINPNFSLLYSQLNSVSNQMPPTEKLDECSKRLILQWITEKAKNN